MTKTLSTTTVVTETPETPETPIEIKKLENQKYKTRLLYIWAKKINTTFKIIIQTLLVLFLMYGSFYIGTLYQDLMTREIIVERQEVKRIGETSVSINERSELMILDRNTGNYQIFQDSVGISIFWLYARQLHDQLK